MEKKDFSCFDPLIAKKFIGDAEGVRLTAYQCSAGIWTVGYGHTLGVSAGQKISQEQAEKWLEADIQEKAHQMYPYVEVPVTKNQFIALVSFAFNVGIAAFRGSRLLKYLNERHYDLAALEFPKWCHASGKRLEGLYKRRLKEQALFRSEDD